MPPARRIVLTTFGSYGDINPFLGLARGLKARGHEPLLATSAVYRADAERAGVAFHAVRPDVDPGDRALVARIMDARRGTEVLLRELLVPRVDEAFEDLMDAVRGADVLVTHPVTFAGPVVAAATGMPWASAVLAPMSFFSPSDLPVFPPAPWLKRLERVPGAATLLVRLVQSVTRGWMEPVRALRRRLGLPPGGDPLYGGQHSPALVLAMYSRLLGAPQPDWPPNVRITGAIPYNGPDEAALPPELEAFLQAGEPPVAFTLGSAATAAAGAFYEESIAAARHAGRRAVLLVGRHPENRPRGPVGDDVLVVEHAPHVALLPRCAATVHQGGVGTLHQALRAGRPMLVVPFAHDQPDNAYRAARLGVARVIAPARYRGATAGAALRRLLEDAVTVARAREAGSAVRGEDGVAAACDAIEALPAGDWVARRDGATLRVDTLRGPA
ncbi:MAG TPA: glycosyltransferase [Gemmatimonadales bacterium]|nr:glycosyltransferase [Gemmatimonadales bacterium]